MDRDLWRLASVVVLGTIMSILDTTIVNVAIETLGRDLDAEDDRVLSGNRGHGQEHLTLGG